MPLSRTTSIAPRSSALTDTVTVEPSGEYLSAFESRFISTWRRRCSSQLPTTLASPTTSMQ